MAVPATVTPSAQGGAFARVGHAHAGPDPRGTRTRSHVWKTARRRSANHALHTLTVNKELIVRFVLLL